MANLKEHDNLKQLFGTQEKINEKVAKDLDKLKIYRSFEELGLESKPTVGQVVNAMIDGSVLIMAQDIDHHIVNSPNVYTILTVKRMTEHRVSLELTGGVASWFMQGNVITLAEGQQWRKNAEGNIPQIATFTSSDISIAAGATTSVTIPFSGLSGKTILGVSAYAMGGIPLETSVNSLGTGSTVLRIKNTGSAVTNRAFRAHVFYTD